MATKAELVKLLEAQVAAKRENKLRSFRPYPKQLEVIRATKDYSEIAFMAGNQNGKSFIVAYIAAVWLTGLYPKDWQGRIFDGPVNMWSAGPSTVLVRDVQQKLLCGPPNDPSAWGTGFIPKAMLGEKTVSHGAGGAVELLKVKHVSGGMSTLVFKSFEMPRERYQGATLDAIVWDEEPPLDIYLEGQARLIATGGVSLAGFTPLHGLNDVVPRFQERSAEAMRNRIIVRATMADAAHLADPEKQAQLMATFPAHQRRARLFGEPMLGSGAVFDVPIDDLVVPLRLVGNEIVHRDLGPLDTRGWAFLLSMDFGIDHPWAATLLGHNRDDDTVYVLAELKMSNAIPAQHCAAMRAIAANVPVAYPHDGNAREKGSGETLASLYKREGARMMPSHAHFEDGSISTERGISEMLTRMKTERLKVAASCVEWQAEYGGYHRKDGLIVKSNDDLMSATRVGIMALRNAQPVMLGSQRAARKPSISMARDVDFDIWG